MYWYGIFRDMEMKNPNDIVSGQFLNSTYTEQKKHSHIPPPTDNKHSYGMDNHGIFKVLEYEFQFIQQLIPEC